MKNIVITLIALALCVQTQAQDRTLTTTDGVTYKSITLQRVEPDGLYIEYGLSGGGIGMSKVKFNRFSAAQQKQFGFNKFRARDYAAEVAQANEDAAQDLIHRYEVARDARLEREAENERAYPARMAEITRLNAAQAEAFYRTASASPIPFNPLSLGADFLASPVASHTSYAPVRPDIFNRGTATKQH